jgi:hypothetical protein
VLIQGCNPIPLGEQADDVVNTPGGPAYRANVHQQGVKDFWPPVEINEVTLGENVTVSYRAVINSVAGVARNNIISVRQTGRMGTSNLTLAFSNVPADIKVSQGASGGGLPGTSFQVLTIQLSETILPGNYTFYIDINLNGKDYGKIPCTIGAGQGRLI